jgi:alanine racemase
MRGYRVWAEIDLAALRHNIGVIRRAIEPRTKIMAGAKADAYGHGALPIAWTALEAVCAMVGVGDSGEAIHLREGGIPGPILILGAIVEEEIHKVVQYDISVTVHSSDLLPLLNQEAHRRNRVLRVHLKIDTGMERIGVHHYNAEGLLEAAARSPHVLVEGIYSHFANADAEDLADARRQLARFEEVLRFYERRSLPLPQRHMANSAAILRLPESHLDLVRPGILLYGVYPFATAPRTVLVLPALSWISRVVYFKVVEAESPVSYGSTWKSDHRVRVVTVPVGYGDGYFRSMSNRAQVILRGQRFAQVGAICMDQMMVNIEDGTGYNGDEVVLIGEQQGERLTVEELAAWAGTIPYEVLTAINDRVPRLYES